MSAHLHTGDEDLEIVGEANYQEALWAICGAPVGDRIRHRVVAVVVPEPQNPHDANAISIQIDGQLVEQTMAPAAPHAWLLNLVMT